MLKPKRKIIISVHGIRTTGSWQKEIAPLMSEQGWIYYPLDYGYFLGAEFALSWLKKAKIDWFRDEYNAIRSRYDVTPSVIAHSNGSYIVSNALLKFPAITVDKVILCGSIVRRDFPWETIFKNKQATLVRNEIGGKDFWSGNVKLLGGNDTGPSGQLGFTSPHGRLRQETFPEYQHSSAFGREHYERYWIPFLDEPMPFEGETTPPWYSEEPVSPQDAARWSAMTYFHQYIRRVNDALMRGEVFAKDTNERLEARCLQIIVPTTPGGADREPRNKFFASHGMKEAYVGTTDRRSVFFKDGILFDIPSTLNSLSYLDHRSDDELKEAVPEFIGLLSKLVSGAKSNCADTVRVIELTKAKI